MPRGNPNMHIQLLLTGNELMSGDTVDSNSATIAQLLGRCGLPIYRKVTIGDDLDLLCNEIEAMSTASELLIINGGLGPTIDDLTALALGRVIGEQLVEHPDAMAHLQVWCAGRNYPINEANRKQAILPRGVEVIANAKGSAVGFRIRHNNCEIYCTPGVPSEMQTMLEQEIVPRVLRHFPNIEPLAVTRIKLFGMGESGLQQLISDQLPDWPEDVELGFRAGLPLLEIKLATRSPQHAALKQQWLDRLQPLIGDYIIGADDTNLAQCLINELSSKGLKICTAESCTGGLIASQLVEIAGASTVFEAGYVTYSDNIKQTALGVKPDTLLRHGAVSEAVVIEMAVGACIRSEAHLAIAVSGIAGPDGGTPEKPVGSVWIAWGYRDAIRTQDFRIPGDRKFFQTLVAAIALDLVRRTLQGIEAEPRYFRERGAKGK